MSQNSSIFSFRSSLGILLLIPGLVVLISWGAQHWAAALGVDAHAYGALVNHQLAKLEKTDQDVRTVFIGDSSLGNAIDVETWEDLGNGKAHNLALMGHFGYAGMYHMTTRALNRLEPKNVVIMHNILLPTYGLNYEVFGDLTISNSLKNNEHSVPAMTKAWLSAYFNLKTVRTNIKRIYRHYAGIEDSKVRGDQK